MPAARGFVEQRSRFALALPRGTFPDHDSQGTRREPAGGEEWALSDCSRKPSSRRCASPAPLASSPRPTRSTARAKAVFRDVDSAYREFHQIYHAWVGTIFEFLFERHGHDALTLAASRGPHPGRSIEFEDTQRLAQALEPV
jgi:hypothetical protein